MSSIEPGRSTKKLQRLGKKQLITSQLAPKTAINHHSSLTE